jgi:phospholipase/carboxylesterase
MPAHIPHETAEHPGEGFRSIVLPGAPGRPVRAYLPTDYQPKYAYPLVVLFHAAGECEEHAARFVPLLSRRNYVALCLRGPVRLGLRADGRPAFGWGAAADRGARAALAHAAAQFSTHPDRVFLVGVGEGASAAYRFGLAPRSGVSGVVALNGALPAGRVPANALRVLIAHGTANPVVPVAESRRAAARLAAAGTAVRLNRYPTSHRVHADMLRDANRWIMDQIADEPATGE